MKKLFALFLGLLCTHMYGQAALAHWRAPISAIESMQAQADAKAVNSVGDVAGNTTAPDTPSTTVVTTCTQNNGKRCPEWVHRLIGQYPPVKEQPEPWNHVPDHFFTVGNGRRALHPDKKSWLIFAAAHAALWGATVTAVRDWRHSGEDAHSEYPAAAFLTGLDFLTFKTLNPAASILPSIYGTVHYIRAEMK